MPTYIVRRGATFKFASNHVEQDWASNDEGKAAAFLHDSFRNLSVGLLVASLGCIALQEGLHAAASDDCYRWRAASLAAYAAWTLVLLVGGVGVWWVLMQHEKRQRTLYLSTHEKRLNHELVRCHLVSRHLRAAPPCSGASRVFADPRFDTAHRSCTLSAGARSTRPVVPKTTWCRMSGWGRNSSSRRSSR